MKIIKVKGLELESTIIRYKNKNNFYAKDGSLSKNGVYSVLKAAGVYFCSNDKGIVNLSMNTLLYPHVEKQSLKKYTDYNSVIVRESGQEFILYSTGNLENDVTAIWNLAKLILDVEKYNI